MASGIEAAHAFIKDVAGYAFHNSSLLEEALDTTGLHSTGSNERLAMIGDSRLKDVILDDWYPTGTTKGMSTTKKKLTSSELTVCAHRKRRPACLHHR
jgi:dsRNA-specific ribonuclease